MSVPNEILELIQSSGNSFHAKVARWLTENGWHVVVSPYYMDQTQSKAREIDLVAEKLWPVHDCFDRKAGDVVVRLFIECKFIATDAVFWFTQKDHEAALALVCAREPFQANNSYTEKHHYLSQSPQVAKLFCSSTTKAAENEPFYKALNQVLNAMVSMRSQPISLKSVRKSPHSPKGIMDLPVVICSSFEKLYSVGFYSEPEPKQIEKNFQLEVRYAYMDRQAQHRDDYFLLDFVAFEKLEEFMKGIDEGASAAAFLASD
jgi:hypothetical protein